MAEYHLGNAEAANEQLRAANESVEKELAETPAWNRKLTLQLLRKEVVELINTDEEKSNTNEDDKQQNN